MVSQFENLGLQPRLVHTVEQMGFEEPTPIQLAALPALLEGRNVIGQAQTGTGKTAAFMLPILQQLQPQKGVVQALVMAPTRELAIQVAEATERMAQNSPIQVMSVYGGQSYSIQIRQLKRGVDIVVGTPGRMLDLINKKLLDLSQVRFLVLDEADEMLKMGFIDDVETILSEVPEDRQTALFSATLPKPIRKLAEKYLTNPYEITINPKRMTVAEIEQRYYQVRKEGKLEALIRLLEVEDVKSALIFARTRAGTRELADELMRRGYPADTLNGDLDQDKRELVLNRFREGVITLLIATDVAARGLDIEDMSHVINFDIPEHPEDYVHRIGRTGRAGRTGVAITLLTPREQGRLRRIEGFTKQAIKACQVPTREDILARRDQRFLERLTEQLGKGKISHERALIAQLSETSFDMIEIAAAAIQLARANEGSLAMIDVSQPVEKPHSTRSSSHKAGTRAASSPKKSKRSNKDKSNRKRDQRDADMVRLKLNLGNAHGLRPGDVVGAIASEVGIPGRAIGEIDIHTKHTFVDVSEKHVRQILKQSSGQYSLRGKPVMLTRVN